MSDTKHARYTAKVAQTKGKNGKIYTRNLLWDNELGAWCRDFDGALTWFEPFEAAENEAARRNARDEYSKKVRAERGY